MKKRSSFICMISVLISKYLSESPVELHTEPVCAACFGQTGETAESSRTSGLRQNRRESMYWQETVWRHNIQLSAFPNLLSLIWPFSLDLVSPAEQSAQVKKNGKKRLFVFSLQSWTTKQHAVQYRPLGCLALFTHHMVIFSRTAHPVMWLWFNCLIRRGASITATAQT